LVGELTHSELLSLLEYGPETGFFRWRIRTNPRAAAGQIAGVVSNGRRYIRINRKRYAAHRLAYFYVYGKWPANEIDHINRNPDDNRISNLRDATRSQNLFNCGNKPDAPPRGIDWYKQTSRWRVRIKRDGKQYALGYFKNIEDAIQARLAAEHKFFPEFPRHAIGG